MTYSEADLKKHLKSEPPARLYLLYGNEPYLAANYAQRISKVAADGELSDFNLHVFDGR